MAEKGFTVELQFDKSVLKASIQSSCDTGIAAVGEEALKDANYYARMDSGEMIRSSIRASKPEEGILVWDEPYAKKVYYAGTPSTDMNPNASLLWAHKAYAENFRKYQNMLAKIAAQRGPTNV